MLKSKRMISLYLVILLCISLFAPTQAVALDEESYTINNEKIPFSFQLVTLSGNSATVSFVASIKISSLKLSTHNTKDFLEPDTNIFTLCSDNTYSFEVVITNHQTSSIYNGVLEFLVCEDTGLVSLETSNITCTEISEMQPKSAGTIYESESNNTYTTADRTYDDYDNYGRLSTSGDIDWWVVRFSSSGNANFWLGNIPSGCDYDLRLYSSNGTNVLGSSVNSNNQSELITYYVTAGVDYYIRINSYSGSSSSYYLFRAKNYPGPTITISKVETRIPQNILSVSRNLPNTGSNACYDYSSNLRPYSGWTAIDYNNSTGHAGTEADRVLRQMKILVTVKNGSTPVSGANVSISTSLGSNAYIYKASSTTNSNGQLTAYIEYYGKKSFTVTATYGGTSKSQSLSTGTATYSNNFYLTVYNFPLRSNFSTWNRFEEAVQINGTGYDDYQNQWYRYNPNGSIIAVSGPNNTSSGTTPTEYRTIAVDSPYITRRQYTSDGSGGSVYHRGKVIIEGLSNASGDNGYRTAEDSGGAINGYHIDLFIGFKTVSQFSSIYGTYIPTSSGHYFPQVRYYSTLVNSY